MNTHTTGHIKFVFIRIGWRVYETNDDNKTHCYKTKRRNVEHIALNMSSHRRNMKSSSTNAHWYSSAAFLAFHLPSVCKCLQWIKIAPLKMEWVNLLSLDRHWRSSMSLNKNENTIIITTIWSMRSNSRISSYVGRRPFECFVYHYTMWHICVYKMLRSIVGLRLLAKCEKLSLSLSHTLNTKSQIAALEMQIDLLANIIEIPFGVVIICGA